MLFFGTVVGSKPHILTLIVIRVWQVWHGDVIWRHAILRIPGIEQKLEGLDLLLAQHWYHKSSRVSTWEDRQRAEGAVESRFEMGVWNPEEDIVSVSQS